MPTAPQLQLDGPGGTGATPTGAGSTGTTAKDVGVAAVVGLVTVICVRSASTIRTQGWVTSVDDWVESVGMALAGLGALFVAEASGTLRRIASRRVRLAVEGLVALVFIAIIVAAFLSRDARRLDLSRDLDRETTSFDVSLAEIGGSGDRFVVAVRPEAPLEVQLVVSRGGTDYTTVAGEDGVVRFDRVLAGDVWRARVVALDGTEGRVTFEAEAHEAQDLAIPASIPGSLADEAAADGYMFTLADPAAVYVGLDGLTAGFRPSLEILSARNVRSAFAEPTETGWEVFERLPEGDYIVTVHAPDRSLGRYQLVVDTSRPDALPGREGELIVPPAGSVVVPDVFDVDIADAERVLASAGFATVVHDVCSSSVPAGHVRQVYRPGTNADVDDVIVVDRPDRPVSTDPIPAGTTLYVRVGNGVACE